MRRVIGVRTIGALLVICCPHGVYGQTASVDLGVPYVEHVRAGQRIEVPVVLQQDKAGALRLAAIQAAVGWDTTSVVFDSLRSVRRTGISLTVNAALASSGQLRFNAYSPEAFEGSGSIATLHFSARKSSGSSKITVSLEAAGDESGRNVMTRVKARGMTFCSGRCSRR